MREHGILLSAVLLATACGSTTDASGGGGSGGAGGGADLVQVEGTACATPEASIVCGRSQDGAKSNLALVCQKGSYVGVGACPEGLPCVDTPSYASVRCGLEDSASFYSVAGSPCPQEGIQVCSFDGAVVHVCQQGKWIAGVHCAPSSCGTYADPASGSWVVGCLNGGYSVGDVCQWSGPGVVCSTDGTKMLGCSGGLTFVSQDCAAAGKHCKTVGATTSCQ